MKKKVVLITGANGMIARRLSDVLGKEYAVRFLTRRKAKDNEYEWDVDRGWIDVKAFQDASHIIHLAGAGISDRRWTNRRKNVILSSRVDTAKLILNTLKEQNLKIDSFISASATGFYGTKTLDRIFDEEDAKGNDFLSNVCGEWEQAANAFTTTGVAGRVVILRFGVVLAGQGGALTKMVKPFKFFMGTYLGNGRQYMPWIHIDDLCGIVKFLLEHRDMQGVYNAVSPQHVTNRNFTHAVAKVLKQPVLLPRIPALILKLMFGEMSAVVLKGSRVSSQKLLDSGYVFRFPKLENALNDLLIKKNIKK